MLREVPKWMKRHWNVPFVRDTNANVHKSKKSFAKVVSSHRYTVKSWNGAVSTHLLNKPISLNWKAHLATPDSRIMRAPVTQVCANQHFCRLIKSQGACEACCTHKLLMKNWILQGNKISCYKHKRALTLTRCTDIVGLVLAEWVRLNRFVFKSCACVNRCSKLQHTVLYSYAGRPTAHYSTTGYIVY